MNEIFKYIILAIGTILGQILIDEFINIWPLFHIFIFPFFIISLPLSINRTLYMIIAVLFGLSVDIFVDGVLGLNGLSCLVLAYIRRPILKLQFANSLIEGMIRVSIKDVGFTKYILFNIILYSIFILVYGSLDTIHSSSYMVSIFWLLLNVLLSVFVACALETTFMNRFSSKFNG